MHKEEEKGSNGCRTLENAFKRADSLIDMAESFVTSFALIFIDDVPIDPASHQSYEGSMPENVIIIDKVESKTILNCV